MTETGAPHAGSCGDGHPHLAFCVLNILGGWSPAVLLECHAKHTPHTRAGRQPSQPLWINKHRLLWGRQQPHLHASKARSRPLPHLNLGQEEPAGVLWGSCSSRGATSLSRVPIQDAGAAIICALWLLPGDVLYIMVFLRHSSQKVSILQAGSLTCHIQCLKQGLGNSRALMGIY